MQIDFHHGVTYVIARLAGFNHIKANIVAYSAQYVDDATNAGQVKFTNGAMYSRISSAHKMLDYRNFKELANHQVWIPFHFLPGNGGHKADENPQGEFINKLICHPDSFVANDMVRACIEDKNSAYGLHRLGITMHVYADTWAHQGFAGVNHEVNHAKKIKKSGGAIDKSFKDRIVNFFVGEAMPLGHGAVLSYPDRPYLKWGYVSGSGENVTRDNPKDFVEAAEHLCIAMQRFIAGDADEVVPGLPLKDKNKIARLIKSIKDEDGEARHAQWLDAISAGEFSFGPVNVNYIPKGKGSWKFQALGTKEFTDHHDDRHDFHPKFLKSNWKLFHDALQAHRFAVLHNILPRYGICAA